MVVLRTLLALPLLTLSLLAALPAGADHPSVTDLDITVAGTPAHGLVSVPHGTPDTLVVVTRGYGHSAESHRGHLEAIADHGAVGLAMDFAGDPADFPLGRGAAETLAAIAHLESLYDFETRIMFSVSMGTPVGAMVMTALPGAFQWWVASEPMANWVETWAEASALGPAIPFAAAAAAGIEEECGGTPAESPDCYAERVALTQVPDFVGVAGAIVLHGVNDGLVPHDQGRELATVLRGALIPTDFYTVLRGEPGGEGTTITGYAGQNVDGLAGHGSESNDAHTLTALSWNVTLRLLDGDLTVVPVDREFVVDRELGTLP